MSVNPTDQNNSAAAGPDRPELQQAVEDIVADAGYAGAQLRVHDERGEWTGSAGLRKLGEAEKPPTDGHFRIGSNTKPFIATLVLQLVADGKVALDTPVADYLPEYGLDQQITVRMLLQHTSGLFNFSGEVYPDGTIVRGIPFEGQEWVDLRLHTYPPRELVEFALSKPARFAPGTDWSYSNTNYVLARLLIEEVTGSALADEMGWRIFEPLGMSGTVVPDASPEIPEPHAHGYYTYEDGGEWKTADVTRVNPSFVSAAGDMISTTQDLHLFISGLLSGKLLPAPLLAEMCTPRPTPLPNMGYGLGVFVMDRGSDGTLITHNGGFWGWGALMYSTPDGSKTLTASMTTGENRESIMEAAVAFEKVQQRLLAEVFGGGQPEATDAAE